MKRDLGALTSREHDVLVIGGGVHGAAAAWDAAQRGLSVALVEALDFGAGTSWNSLKTIHGGLRHLQRADVRSVRESAHERSALMRIAPALVRPLSFLVPLYGHGSRGPTAMRLALWINDRLTRDRNDGLAPAQWIPDGRVLSRAEALERLPVLDARGLAGAALWTDAQIESSERLVIGLLHAAETHGAVVANQVAVTALTREGRRVSGVRAWDVEDCTEIDVRARCVLSAAGPALDDVLALAQVRPRRIPLVEASNLVMRGARVREAIGARHDGRYLFLVPWSGRTLVGTDYARPTEGAHDSLGLLRAAQAAFPWADLRESDVLLEHRGRVPGRDAYRLRTRSAVFDHAADDAPGLISILSAKYTTARATAECAVDRVVQRLRRPCAPCLTHTTPLAHARPLDGTLEERTRIAVREECARHLTDAVLRRLDLGTGGPPDEADLDGVSRVMAAECGWDASRVKSEREALAAVYVAKSSVLGG